jgi:catechol 2,3-dioxygenase-like lactoylglutathione lyase family enzyme
VTQISGYIPPQRRAGELGVHSVDGFNIMVPNLTEASNFYSAFGLTLQNEQKGFGLYTEGHAHRWGTVSEGAKKKLSFISFGAFEEDFGPLRTRLQANGIKELDPPAGFESNGVWFHNPDGMPIEIRVAAKSSPNEKSTFAMVSAPPGVQGASFRSTAPKTFPRRLAHVLMFTADVPRSLDFYHRVLGLRLSDRSGDGIAFMHGIHGSDHHMIAFAKSDGPGLHHLSWDVGSVNDIGLGANQMADKGYTKGWGLGRHVLGSNYFHYVRDPWGSYCEYSADIDYIPVDHDWASGDRDPEDAFYLWGPVPPEDFVTNFETQS